MWKQKRLELVCPSLFLAQWEWFSTAQHCQEIVVYLVGGVPVATKPVTWSNQIFCRLISIRKNQLKVYKNTDLLHHWLMETHSLRGHLGGHGGDQSQLWMTEIQWRIQGLIGLRNMDRETNMVISEVWTEGRKAETNTNHSFFVMACLRSLFSHGLCADSHHSYNFSFTTTGFTALLLLLPCIHDGFCFCCDVDLQWSKARDPF